MSSPYISPCYCTNTRRAAGIITELYDDALRPFGLNAAQYYLLINLSRLEPMDTTHFANHVGLDRSTLVRNIRILQNNGWVEDQANGQKHQFRLTQSGRMLLEKATPVWEETQNDFSDQMGHEDSKELMRLLRKVQALKPRKEA